MDPKFHILVAEDNEDDAFILQTALKKIGIQNPVQICRNGQDVIDYLKGEGSYADRAQFPFPRLMLIDLKMPVVTGLDVLRWLKGNEECSVVPTVVLTSSKHEEDVDNAYKLGANAYMVKPGRMEQFEKALMLIDEFWNACQLPKLPERC